MQLTRNSSPATLTGIRQLQDPVLADLVKKHGKALTEAQARIEQLDAAAAKVPAVECKGADAVMDAITSGKSKIDILALFERDAIAEAAHVVATRELSRLRSRLVNQHVAAAAELLDRAPAYLTERLQAIVAEARELRARPGELGSAEAAIRAGRGDDWARLRELAADYEQIRAAQRQIYSAGPLAEQMNHNGPHGLDWAWVALVANAEAVEPLALHEKYAEITAPWDFDWLIEHVDAVAWVPSPAQYMERAQALRDARTAALERKTGKPHEPFRRPTQVAKFEQVGYRGPGSANRDVPVNVDL